MPIDSSIYQNVKAPDINLPQPMDMAKTGMYLSQMGMQQQQMQYQLAQRKALMGAYAQNTGQSGNLDRQGFLSTLGQTMPQAVPEAAAKFAAQDKAQAEALSAKADAVQKIAAASTPGLLYLDGIKDPDQQARSFQGVRQQWQQAGLPMGNVPDQFKADWLNYSLGQVKKSPAYADLLLKQSEAAKNNSDQFKTGAEELGKLNEDANNPTNRKITGGLTDIAQRADRIVTLANAGAPPNETPDQRAARLNKIMPQIAKEFNISLATIMQGGVPTEGLEKELGTDTVESGLAGLKQKFSGTPTGANQGAMIQQYVDTAQHLGNWASERLQAVNQRSKAAYPYANKLFPDAVAKIIAPIPATQSSAQSGAPALGQGDQGGSGIIRNANASERPSAPTPLPSGMIRIKGPDGKVYRVPQAQKGEAIAAGGSVVK